MKKLEELVNKRDAEIESQRKASEEANEARKKEFQEKLWSDTLTGGGIGFAVSLVVGFFKGCGLFHYDPNHSGKAYIFDTKDAGENFWVLPLVGIILGFLYAMISSKLKTE